MSQKPHFFQYFRHENWHETIQVDFYYKSNSIRSWGKSESKILQSRLLIKDLRYVLTCHCNQLSYNQTLWLLDPICQYLVYWDIMSLLESQHFQLERIPIQGCQLLDHLSILKRWTNISQMNENYASKLNGHESVTTSKRTVGSVRSEIHRGLA